MVVEVLMDRTRSDRSTVALEAVPMGLDAAPITFSILGITILASLGAWSNRALMHGQVLQPYAVVRYGRWHQLLTSGFLHANGAHLFLNMFTLFFFGPPMERALGSLDFLVLYVGSLLAGSFATLAFHKDDPGYRAVGASGAISGVVFGFVLFRPLAKIYLFLIPIGIPAVLFAIGYLAVSLYGARTRWGNIGHTAHLGGAVGGIVLTVLLYPRVVGIFLSHFR
ncbi:MAG: rhomboid family intramembrane serine protease [Candidatus Eisenbacteria bacterium]|nr:rhomboid family intramembrane serine protease [Candidatus Latescibacterota bacterium]MBD3303445.1 rhomboid family intramembrane serine protease [Candidatus Eisenbacteria bacterium]